MGGAASTRSHRAPSRSWASRGVRSSSPMAGGRRGALGRQWECSHSSSAAVGDAAGYSKAPEGGAGSQAPRMGAAREVESRCGGGGGGGFPSSTQSSQQAAPAAQCCVPPAPPSWGGGGGWQRHDRQPGVQRAAAGGSGEPGRLGPAAPAAGERARRLEGGRAPPPPPPPPRESAPCGQLPSAGAGAPPHCMSSAAHPPHPQDVEGEVTEQCTVRRLFSEWPAGVLKYIQVRGWLRPRVWAAIAVLACTRRTPVCAGRRAPPGRPNRQPAAQDRPAPSMYVLLPWLQEKGVTKLGEFEEDVSAWWGGCAARACLAAPAAASELRSHANPNTSMRCAPDRPCPPICLVGRCMLLHAGCPGVHRF